MAPFVRRWEKPPSIEFTRGCLRRLFVMAPPASTTRNPSTHPLLVPKPKGLAPPPPQQSKPQQKRRTQMVWGCQLPATGLFVFIDAVCTLIGRDGAQVSWQILCGLVAAASAIAIAILSSSTSTHAGQRHRPEVRAGVWTAWQRQCEARPTEYREAHGVDVFGKG